MLSAKERIKNARPTTKTVPVWLGADLDLLDEYEAAERELEQAQKPADSLAGNGSVSEIQARIDALKVQLDEYRMDFRVRGLDDFHLGRLVAAHPPRKNGEDVDPRDVRGWNSETFPSALVRATVVSPELDDEDWLALLGDEESLGTLTSGQLDDLASVAFRLSRVSVDVPFSRAASPTTPNSGRE